MIPQAPTMALIDSARVGDPDAWNHLASVWLPVVVGWSCRLGGRRVDAHDCAHEVFIVVIRRLDKLYDREKFQSWLFGITRKVVASQRRRAWVRLVLLGLKHEPVSTRMRPDQQAELSERARLIHDALEKLPANQREVVVLCEIEGRTSAEAAELIGVAEGTVKSRLRLARQRLHRMLKGTDLVQDGEAS